MKIFIPSYDRAGSLPAVKYLKDAGIPCAVVVAQSQRAAYATALTEIEILTVPDALDSNVNRKRNAVLNLIAAEPDKTGWMVDDDVEVIARCFSCADAAEKFAKKSHAEVLAMELLTPAEAAAALLDLAKKAKEQGAVYFGFSNTRRYSRFNPAEPYSRDGFFSRVQGFIHQPGMRFDESLVRGGSIDFFLQMAGKTLRDNRYYPVSAPPVPKKAGGIGVTVRQRKEDFVKLQQKWGTEAVLLGREGIGVTSVRPDKIHR